MSGVVIYFIKLILLPPISLLILALAALLFGKPKQGRHMAIVCLTLLGLLSLPIVIKQLAGLWERVPPLSIAAVQHSKPQALVVIGGGLDHSAAEYPGQITLHSRSLLRIRYAAKLAKELDLPILVSGGRVIDSEPMSEAKLMAAALDSEFKTPVSWQESDSKNTTENARFSYTLLSKQGVNNIVLVTQAYHMPRAASEFRKAGFTVLPAPTAFISSDAESLWQDWLPSPSAWTNSYLLAHEMIGMIWYRIRY